MTIKFELKTTHISTFRILFEALKEVLIDVNIEFTPEGLHIRRIDSDHILYIDLSIYGENIDVYECVENLNIGVNISNFFKIIKTCINNVHTLHIYYDDEDDGVLNIIIENVEKKKKTTHKMNLIEINHDDLNFPDFEYSNVIHMPSVDFQKEIKDINQFTDKQVEITTEGTKLFFRCDGDFATYETELEEGDTESAIKFEERKSDSKIEGFYDINRLMAIVKCTNMCKHIKLKIGKGYPLTIQYPIGSLGELEFIVAANDDE